MSRIELQCYATCNATSLATSVDRVFPGPSTSARVLDPSDASAGFSTVAKTIRDMAGSIVAFVVKDLPLAILRIMRLGTMTCVT